MKRIWNLPASSLPKLSFNITVANEGSDQKSHSSNIRYSWHSKSSIPYLRKCLLSYCISCYKWQVFRTFWFSWPFLHFICLLAAIIKTRFLTTSPAAFAFQTSFLWCSVISQANLNYYDCHSPLMLRTFTIRQRYASRDV